MDDVDVEDLKDKLGAALNILEELLPLAEIGSRAADALLNEHDAAAKRRHEAIKDATDLLREPR